MSEMNRIQLMKLEREETEKVNKAERDLEAAYRKLKALRQDAYGGSAAKEEKKNVATGVGAAGRGRGVAAAAGPASAGPAPGEAGRGVPRKVAQGGRGEGAPAGGRGGPLKAPAPGGGRGLPVKSPRPGPAAPAAGFAAFADQMKSPRGAGDSAVSPRPQQE